MMDCKKALVECEGDIEKALDLLRSNSALKAEKKSSRVAADGILVVSVNEDYATLVELNSETDFAAKDANFLSFGEKVKEYISKNKIFEASALKESSLEDDRKALVQTIGENIQIRRVVTLEFDSSMNIGIYIHSDSKLGSLVVTKDGNDEIAKDIAMHVSAFNPLCLSQDDIDKDVLEREKAIYQNQAQDSGKPQDIMDKMVDGKVNRFLSEVSLLSQSFVKDPDITVEEYLSNENNIAARKENDLKIKLDIESNKRKLTTKALVSFSEREFLKNIIKKLSNQNLTSNHLIKLCNERMVHTKNWDVFMKLFNDIHPDFNKYIIKKAISISESELRVCNLIKMNFSTLETAEILAITIRGVEQHRYRIKKKLKLKTDLTVFLQSI